MKRLMKTTSVALCLGAMLLTIGCKKDPKPSGPEVNTAGTFSQVQLITAISTAYANWEQTTTIPASFGVEGKELTPAEFLYAECKVLSNIVTGNSENIKVLSYKPASHPERDSYDAKTIAVSGGPANGNETEDLANIAKRLLAKMEADGVVPNQTLFTRDGAQIAYSTNRAIVTLARAIAAYKKDGSFPRSVSTDYLPAAATLKAFAQELIGYLDVWNNTTGTVSADGSHCTANGTPWENVHFIPVPFNGGYTDGEDQYAEQYKPYKTITVNGTEYDAAACWEIALKGILDLVTKEGSALVQEDKNTFIHTMGNGASLSEPIPATHDWAIFGAYPWYEKADEGGPCNFSTENPCNIDFIVRTASWFLTRAPQLGKIGNYQIFGTDPSKNIVYGNYEGFVSSMRMFLIAIRFYDYLLKNDISSNVYESVKNVSFDPDLYGVKMPDVTLKTKSLSLPYAESQGEVSFTATDTWTATSDQDWLTLDPANGAASVNKLTVKAKANTGRERTATVSITCKETKVELNVVQAAYVAATIKDFANSYITLLNIWETTTGSIDMIQGENYTGGSYIVENAHYIPSTTTITLGGAQLSIADALEIGLRSFLMLRGFDGNYIAANGVGKIPTTTEAYTMNSSIPATHGYKWAEVPFNETPSNGGHLRMGASKESSVPRQVKIDWLDNFAQRNVNFALTNSDRGGFANLSGYEGRLEGYYGCASMMRGLITYAHFFKYMLDQNLSDAKSISADQIFTSDLFGVDEGYTN